MITVIACVAQFVVVLDVTIVAIALPAMQADLGLSTTALGWVITAYTLVFGGCLLAAGRLADRVGRRRAFVGGLVLFAAASLACGLASSGAALLAARAVQGLGAGLVDGRGRRRRRQRLGARRPALRAAGLALDLPGQRAAVPRRGGARPTGPAGVARPRGRPARRRRRRAGHRRAVGP